MSKKMKPMTDDKPTLFEYFLALLIVFAFLTGAITFLYSVFL